MSAKNVEHVSLLVEKQVVDPATKIDPNDAGSKVNGDKVSSITARLNEHSFLLGTYVDDALDVLGNPSLTALVLHFAEVLGPLERDIAFLCERLYEVKMLVQEKEEELQITSAEYRETAKHRSDLEKTKALLELKRKELDLVVAEHRALMSKHNPFSEPTDEFKAELKALMMKGKELQQQVDDLEANEKAKQRDSSAHVSVEMAKAMDGLSELQMKQAALEESKEKKTQALERCQQLDIKCRAIVLTTPILSPDEVRSMTASSNRMLLLASRIREEQILVLNCIAEAVELYSHFHCPGGEFRNGARTVSLFLQNLGGQSQPTKKGGALGIKAFPKGAQAVASNLNSTILRGSFNFAPKHGAFNLQNEKLNKLPSQAKALLLTIHHFIKAYRSTFEKAHAGGVAFDLE